MVYWVEGIFKRLKILFLAVARSFFELNEEGKKILIFRYGQSHINEHLFYKSSITIFILSFIFYIRWLFSIIFNSKQCFPSKTINTASFQNWYATITILHKTFHTVGSAIMFIQISTERPYGVNTWATRNRFVNTIWQRCKFMFNCDGLVH